jgi:hypothetical protein
MAPRILQIRSSRWEAAGLAVHWAVNFINVLIDVLIDVLINVANSPLRVPHPRRGREASIPPTTAAAPMAQAATRAVGKGNARRARSGSRRRTRRTKGISLSKRFARRARRPHGGIGQSSEAAAVPRPAQMRRACTLNACGVEESFTDLSG